MKRRDIILLILVGLTSLSLAGVAAYFSVFGLSKLFVAKFTIILFSILELGKLIGVTYLHSYWKTIHWFKKSYMLLGVIIMMTITSIGIYGYLSASYSSTSMKLNVINKKVELLKHKKIFFNKQIESINKQINFKDKRINQLTNLRTQQETRLDSLVNNKYWYNAKATRKEIDNSNKEIKTIGIDIVNYNKKIVALNDSISKYDIQIIQMNNNDHSVDLGPLKHLSDAFNISMDRLVNFLIFAIIIIFDPMAISLLLAFNDILKRYRKDENDEDDNNEIPINKDEETDKNKNKETDKNKDLIELKDIEKLKSELNNIKEDYIKLKKMIENDSDSINENYKKTQNKISDFNKEISKIKELNIKYKSEIKELIKETNEEIENFKDDFEDKLHDKFQDFKENLQDKLDDFWDDTDRPNNSKTKIIFK